MVFRGLNCGEKGTKRGDEDSVQIRRVRAHEIYKGRM